MIGAQYFSRFESQLPIPEIGEDGQQRLLDASVLVVGAGGLGSTALYCLAGAGVGRLGIADGDVVSLSNLNRQFLYTPADVGQKKALAAVRQLSAFYPCGTIEPYPISITCENAAALAASYDLVILAVDSLVSRLAVNEACCLLGKSLIDGGVDGYFGRALVVEPGKTACLQCIYGDSAVTRQPHPLSFAPVVSLIASLEAQLALTLLMGRRNPVPNRILYYDGHDLSLQKISVRKNPDCTVCGAGTAG